MAHHVIIGAGQAAASCAAKLRALNKDDNITIIGDEPSLPYQRPPLSKKYLGGEMEASRLLLRPANWYTDNNVTVKTATRVRDLDRANKQLTLEGGSTVSYDKLVFATGSRPRDLPDAMTKGAKNIYGVRTLADVDAMRHEFTAGRKLLVIGGGYIGLEAAAIARKFDVDVTLVEAAPRILGRVASPATADFFRDLHTSHGVNIIEGAGLDHFAVTNDRIQSAILTNGQTLACDFVISGIGIHPNCELAQNAGINCDQGILVDEFSRTNDPDIYAAGDCARFDIRGELVRLESVPNAIDQGENVAIALAGQPTPYIPRPWFWSDQYDYTLQIAGLNLGYESTVTRPGSREGTQSVWYYAGDQLLAVDAMNDPRAFAFGRKIIEAGKTIPPEVAADGNSDLKTYL